ncbi:response regulator receiver domain protein [Rhodoferax ferrireducens T118]|uniref:Response regulator receiver domain protein n=1 Tax=Albidiferax ferrireducens (strain ATCC BAA-621 / DSM 15236 / T118) TaxID=338969 RepID=Q221S4_ALBFT|nr:tetratricopeptide repeat protein [Rhodoferax ferrireducens]ABD68229.1 response regulator receiver domain protein [Rhodoferax ferrireducens T118]
MTFSLPQANTLIIDDFQGMRTMLRDFVRLMGVTRIDTASNGHEAINQLSANKYDIVICDYNLGPGANGQQVLEEAKLRNFVGVSTIWVMVTAEKTTDMVMGAAEVKPDDYLLKPINQVLLQSRLEKLITRKQSLGAIEAAIRTQDYSAAIALCDQQLNARAVNPQEVLRIKSDLLLTLGDYPAARTLFESVLALRSVAWAKTGLGKVLFYGQDYAGAVQLFQQVLQENRMYMEAADWLAKTLDAMGDSAQAQQVLEDAVQLSPNSPIRQKTLGDTAYRNGALDVAQAAFEKTIKISEFSPHKNPAVYARLARVFSDQDSPEEALNILKRSKADFRYNPAAALQTAAAESLVYQKMGQVQKAEAAMLDAERLMEQLADKVSPEMTMEVAKALFKLGKKDKACGLLRDLVKNNHEDGELSRQIGAVFEGENMAEEGQTLIKASRNEVIDINNQGVTLAKQGDFQQAVKLLRTAAQQLPHNEVISVNLCGLLIGLMQQKGKTEDLVLETRELLGRVREMNPVNQKYRAYALALARLTNEH